MCRLNGSQRVCTAAATAASASVTAALLPLVYDFKSNKHQLPLARIKKIMKSDEDVRMISAEAPVLFAKACELFILVRFSNAAPARIGAAQRCGRTSPAA